MQTVQHKHFWSIVKVVDLDIFITQLQNTIIELQQREEEGGGREGGGWEGAGALGCYPAHDSPITCFWHTDEAKNSIVEASPRNQSCDLI